MNYVYPTLMATALIFSCGTRIDYLGTRHAKTETIDFFVDPSAIERPYTVVGKGYVGAGPGTFLFSAGKIQAKAIAKAKQTGADAVLVQDLYLPATGASISSVFHTDSVGKAAVTVGNSTLTATGTRTFDIRFLKYKRN